VGRASYKSYARDYVLSGAGKPHLPGSSDPAFRGDATRYNPEEMLVGSLASCHMLWYLHLCAEAGVRVLAYRDEPTGTMVEDARQGGRFIEVILRPRVTIAKGELASKACALHETAQKQCFIANSVNFPVGCEPEISVSE
jgi:organic hydroperoxide reductase OsmC/OhrA